MRASTAPETGQPDRPLGEEALYRLLAERAPGLIGDSDASASRTLADLVECLGSTRGFLGVDQDSDANAVVLDTKRGAGWSPAHLALLRASCLRVRDAALLEEADPADAPLLRALGVPSLLLVRSEDDGATAVLGLAPAPATGDVAPPLRAFASVLDAARRRTDAWTHLRSDQDCYRSLLRSEVVGVLVIDLEGHVYQANQAALRSLGRNEAEVANGEVSWIDHSPPEFLDADRRAMREQMEKGYARPYHREILGQDGRRLPILIGTVPLQGSADRFLCVVLDMTPVKRAERALRRRNDEMRLAAELSTRFVRTAPTEIDAEITRALGEIGRFFTADLAVLFDLSTDRKSGVPVQGWISERADDVRGGRPLRDIPLESFSWLFEKLREENSLHAPDVASQIPEGSREFAWLRERGFRAAIVVPVGVGEEPSALFTLISFEPRPHWSGDSIPTFRILGEMIVNARERRRRDEERQQRDRATRLIADLSTALVNLPTEAIDTAIDEALEKVGQLIGSDGCAIFRSNEKHTRARLTHVWSPLFSGRRSEYSIVDLHLVAGAYSRLRAGETIAVPDCTVLGDEDPALAAILAPFGVRSLALVPMTLGGELVGLGGYVWMQQQHSDVAALDPMLRLLGELIVNAEARKRSDETLRQLNANLEERVQERTAQLQAINREMSSFSYSVSHDLRLPLRSINGYTHILREEHGHALSAEASALLDEVSRASRRMGELIDALLSLSRISRSEFRAVRVNLSALAEEIAARLRRSAPERQVTFDIAPGLEATGEPRLLAIAMENLLQNAWKFTSRRDAATIELGVAVQNEAPTFYVRDNGAGFDPRHRAKLFGTFQRLHRSDEFEGHGVGLASVQRIVKLHGGDIWADGAIDQGATFWFTLPAR